MPPITAPTDIPSVKTFCNDSALAGVLHAVVCCRGWLQTSMFLDELGPQAVQPIVSVERKTVVRRVRLSGGFRLSVGPACCVRAGSGLCLAPGAGSPRFCTG